MIRTKLNAKGHYLKIYNQYCYLIRAEVWTDDLKIPIYTNDFSSLTPLLQIVEWGNNQANKWK